jgi:hypothetical protein
MTYEDFCEGLQLLARLERHELIHLRAVTEDDYQAWRDFKRDPLRWLLRADAHRAAAVWGAIERGRRGRPPTNFVGEAASSSELNVIQLVPREIPNPSNRR